ncbi:MAG: hypothetical protein OXU67_00550 [Chloroflexota bacterium]|nr:hypothetical protein [Chloroflexota bacterium]
MIVTAMRAYRVRVQPTDPIRTGRGPVPARADLLVELVTDDGRSGWGNGSDSESGIAALAGAAPHILGVDPSRIDPRVLWTTLREALPIGPLSAVDTALWDLRGQALGQSVAGLLGAESGHVRPQVRAYATGLFRRERWTAAEHARELVIEAEGYAAAGYTAMKLKTGFGLDADTRHTAAIRRAIGPDIALYVDSNAAYTPQQSIAFGEAIADYDVGWMEEPTGPLDWAGYHQVRVALASLSAPIPGGGGGPSRPPPPHHPPRAAPGRGGGPPPRGWPGGLNTGPAGRAPPPPPPPRGGGAPTPPPPPTSPPAAMPRPGTWSSPTWSPRAASPACGAWVG